MFIGTKKQMEVLEEAVPERQFIMGRWWGNEPVGETEMEELQHQSTLFHYKKNILILFQKAALQKAVWNWPRE